MKSKWVKRAMALFLAAAMVFSLTACGSSSGSSSETEAEEEETEAEEEEEEYEYEVVEGTAVEIEAVTFADTDDVSVVITGLSVGGTDLYGNEIVATLTVEVENKTDSDLAFFIDSISVNGVSVVAYAAENEVVGAAESAEVDYYVFGDEDVDLGDITVISLAGGVQPVENLEEEDGEILSYETSGEVLAEGSVDIYPDGEENAVLYVRESEDTDVVLTEDPATITFIGGSDEEFDGEWYGYNVNFYIENDSEEDLLIEVILVSVNGTETSAYGGYAIDLLAGTRGYLSLFMDGEYDLEDLDITESSQIETAEVQITIYDLETYDEISIETYTITLN